MNRNVVGAILIIAALALVYFFAWPRIRAYTSTPAGDAAPIVATDTTATL